MDRELPADFTELLEASRAGSERALQALLPVVYDELRRQARGAMQAERASHTLDPTALVHEAYVRLVEGANSPPEWRDRGHFVCIAARAMRQILVGHARRRARVKHGGDRSRVPLDEVLAVYEDRSFDLLALDEALTDLRELDSFQADMIELRFFGGASVDRVAAILGLSKRTAERELGLARAWLRRRIEPSIRERV